MSLSYWFRDYLYIPLGGSRKGETRKEVNRMFVFAVSGLWHGASLAFICWGVFNGAAQAAEDVMDWLKVRLANGRGMKAARFSRRLMQTAVTFVLITIAWLPFRCGGLETTVEVLRNMCRFDNWVGILEGTLSVELLGGPVYMRVLLGSILALFIVDYHKYKGRDAAELFLGQEWWFRTAIIMVMLFTILLFGCYGEIYDTQQFIYFQF